MEERLYQQLYESYECKHWWFMSKKEIVLYLLDKYAKGNSDIEVIDLACGAGFMLKALRKYGQVTGVDISERAIQYSKINDPEARLLLGDVTNEKLLPRNYANIILALDMLEHVENDQLMLENIYNILQDNGMFFLTVPAYQFLWSRHDEIHNHFRRYSRREINFQLEKSGFQIEKSSYYNFFLFFPAILVRLWKKLIKKDTDDLVILPLWLNQILKSIFSLEKHWLRVSSFPCGLSIICVARKTNTSNF